MQAIGRKSRPIRRVQSPKTNEEGRVKGRIPPLWDGKAAERRSLTPKDFRFYPLPVFALSPPSPASC